MVNFFEDAEYIIKYECNRVAINNISFKTSTYYKCIHNDKLQSNKYQKEAKVLQELSHFPGVGCFCSLSTQFS